MRVKHIVKIAYLVAIFLLFLIYPAQARAQTCSSSVFKKSTECLQRPQYKEKVSEYLTIFQGRNCADYNNEQFSSYQELIVKYPDAIYETLLSPQTATTCNIYDSLGGWVIDNCDCDGSQAADDSINGDARSNYVRVITSSVVQLINSANIQIAGTPIPTAGPNVPTPTDQPDPTPTYDPARAAEFAAMIANNCGTSGLSCCEIDARSYEGLTPPLFGWFEGKGIIGKITDWFAGMVTEGIVSSQNEIAATAEGQTLCKGNLQPSLARSKKSPLLGLNNFDQENQTYFIEEDCTPYLSVTEEDSYRECMANRVRPIPKAEIASCSCVDPDGESIDPRKIGQIYDYGHDPKMIENQICLGSKPCEKCMKDGGYWQSWLASSPLDLRCVDTKDEAEVNLNSHIDQITQSSPALNTLASISNLKSSNVLSVQGSFCVEITDEVQRKSCERCIANTWFWNRAGCTEKSISSLHSRKLCANIEGATEKNSCNQCVYSGSFWTAIGCIEPNLSSFIEKKLFGMGLGLVGTVALGCIMYAGFLLQTSTGDPEKVKKAQELMTSCITGLIIIIFSIFILRIIGVDILRLPGLS